MLVVDYLREGLKKHRLCPFLALKNCPPGRPFCLFDLLQNHGFWTSQSTAFCPAPKNLLTLLLKNVISAYIPHRGLAMLPFGIKHPRSKTILLLELGDQLGNNVKWLAAQLASINWYSYSCQGTHNKHQSSGSARWKSSRIRLKQFDRGTDSVLLVLTPSLHLKCSKAVGSVK